jgi:hypothetical protein
MLQDVRVDDISFKDDFVSDKGQVHDYDGDGKGLLRISNDISCPGHKDADDYAIFHK